MLRMRLAHMRAARVAWATGSERKVMSGVKQPNTLAVSVSRPTTTADLTTGFQTVS